MASVYTPGEIDSVSHKSWVYKSNGLAVSNNHPAYYHPVSGERRSEKHGTIVISPRGIDINRYRTLRCGAVRQGDTNRVVPNKYHAHQTRVHAWMRTLDTRSPSA